MSTPRSHSRTRPQISRPTTPLRPPSRTSLRASTTAPSHDPASNPLETLEPAFAELSDSLADLEANMQHLSLLHESVSRFNENFASFLYGLNMSAFCVDFPEAPGGESFKRAWNSAPLEQEEERYTGPATGLGGGGARDVDATFLTTDTSFVDNPPMSARGNKFATPRKTTGARGSGIGRGSATRGRGGIPTRGSVGSGRGGSSSARGSGIGRGRARGVR